MLLSLHSSATGMEAQQLQLNTIANNLANANTTGFKRGKIEFQDMLYQRQREAGSQTAEGGVLPNNVEMGNGAQVVATSRVFTQGTIRETGERMDVAIDGQGFLEVEMPDGSTGFTRDGSLKVSSDGRIINSQGYPILSGATAIPEGTVALTIAPTGEVTVTDGQGNQNLLFTFQLVRFNNPGGLRSVGGNLYQESEASGSPELGSPGQDGYGRLLQGYVEGSNVNVVEEMVNMITAQRAYEINSKAIQTSEEMMKVVSQLKR